MVWPGQCDYWYHTLYHHARHLHGENFPRMQCPAMDRSHRQPAPLQPKMGESPTEGETVSNRTRPSTRRKAVAAPTTPRQTDAAGNFAASIGRVARRIREDLGLTLANVAEQARISPGMLSRLETGRVSPSLETIVALAEVLGVRPALLLQEVGEDEGDAQHVPDGQGLEVVRRGTKRGHTYHLLAAQRGPRKVFEPFLVTLTDKSEIFPGFQHAGTEFIYILTGEIRYRHGKESFLLKEGDSLTFRGDVAHGPERLVKVPIRMLSVIIYGGSESD
jgi:transcriptional regulator with XRE-family HTH domain